jgi:hypothetical protein
MRNPVILFAIGDADWRYTQGKFRPLLEKIAAERDWKIRVASHAKEICQAFKDSPVKSFHLPVESVAHLPEQAIEMTDLMVRLTRDVSFPNSNLPLWKTIGMDDYMGCLSICNFPALPIKPDLVVYPLVGIDNTTHESSHFYTAIAAEARKAKAPMLGLELSPLGNRQTLAASLADYYAVKSDFSRSFVVNQGLAPAERVWILPPEESYLLTCRTDPFLDQLLTQENATRARLGISPGHLMIFIPHNVAFVFETRELLKSLQGLRFPFTVVLNVTPNIARHSLKEKEIVQKAYKEELKGLPNVIINEEEGWLWTLLLADVVLSPACSVFTELAAFYGKLTIVSQAFGEKNWVGENLFLEPQPARAVSLIQTWVENRLLLRKGLNRILNAIVDEPCETTQEAAYGA